METSKMETQNQPVIINKMSKLKRLNIILMFMLMVVLARTSNSHSLKLHYGLSGDAVNSKTVIDESGSGYTGSASLIRLRGGSSRYASATGAPD